MTYNVSSGTLSLYTTTTTGFKLIEKSNFTIRTFSKNIPSPTRDTHTPKIERTSKLTHFGTLSLSAIKFSCT